MIHTSKYNLSLTKCPAGIPPTSLAPFDVLEPLRLPAGRHLMPEQFELVCAENSKSVLELAEDGGIIAKHWSRYRQGKFVVFLLKKTYTMI